MRDCSDCWWKKNWISRHQEMNLSRRFCISLTAYCLHVITLDSSENDGKAGYKLQKNRRLINPLLFMKLTEQVRSLDSSLLSHLNCIWHREMSSN